MTFKTSIFFLCLCLITGSCTLVLKSMARSIVKDYDNYTDVNLSNIQLNDHSGKQRSFKEMFKGKVVYLYVSKDPEHSTKNDKDKKYSALKQRFKQYPDVIFATISVCNNTTDSTAFYRLICDSSSAEFRSILIQVTDKAPFIIGKNGKILAFKGPKPNDDLLVDYVLFEARKGIDGTTSARKLIKGVNKKARFKSRELREWYTKHFNKSPDSLDFSFSSTD